MPRYVYRCQECEQDFEFLQPMADKPIKRVPNGLSPCGERCKSLVDRVLGANVNLRQGQTEHVTDKRGTKIDRHWDGRQDVTVKPDPVKTGLKINPIG